MGNEQEKRRVAAALPELSTNRLPPVCSCFQPDAPIPRAVRRGQRSGKCFPQYRARHRFCLQEFASYCLAFGNFRREFVKVGMRVLAEQMARSTLAAGFMAGLGRFAQQCLRDKAANSVLPVFSLPVNSQALGRFCQWAASCCHWVSCHG